MIVLMPPALSMWRWAPPRPTGVAPPTDPDLTAKDRIIRVASIRLTGVVT